MNSIRLALIVAIVAGVAAVVGLAEAALLLVGLTIGAAARVVVGAFEAGH